MDQNIKFVSYLVAYVTAPEPGLFSNLHGPLQAILVYVGGLFWILSIAFLTIFSLELLFFFKDSSSFGLDGLFATESVLEAHRHRHFSL
jgi:hypothetical protein